MIVERGIMYIVKGDTMTREEAFVRICDLAAVWGKHAATTEGGAGLAAGCGEIGYRWKEGVMYAFVDYVKQGMSIADAGAKAKDDGREFVKRHNARRPKDTSWQRWLGTADSAVDTAVRILTEAV
jgi:hypothetical protein